jgi:DNA-binding CsgD family transcriptional regulator
VAAHERSRTRAAGARGRPEAVPALDIAPPPDLRAVRFDLGNDGFAILDFSFPPQEHLECAAVLTPAEREVVELVLRGKSNREVAEARGTSVRTVANQLAVAFRKLGVSGRLQLYALAAQGRWQEDSP